MTYKFNKNPEKFFFSSTTLHSGPIFLLSRNKLGKVSRVKKRSQEKEERNLRNLPITSALTSAFVLGSQWGLCGWQVFAVFLLSEERSLSTRCCHVMRSVMYSSSALSRRMINLPPSPRCLSARIIIMP